MFSRERGLSPSGARMRSSDRERRCTVFFIRLRTVIQPNVFRVYTHLFVLLYWILLCKTTAIYLFLHFKYWMQHSKTHFHKNKELRLTFLYFFRVCSYWRWHDKLKFSLKSTSRDINKTCTYFLFQLFECSVPHFGCKIGLENLTS